MKATNAKGVIQLFDACFKVIGVEEFKEKLFVFGPDGASVNQGKKEGVKRLLQVDCPWFVLGWCAT